MYHDDFSLLFMMSSTYSYTLGGSSRGINVQNMNFPTGNLTALKHVYVTVQKLELNQEALWYIRPSASFHSAHVNLEKTTLKRSVTQDRSTFTHHPEFKADLQSSHPKGRQQKRLYTHALGFEHSWREHALKQMKRCMLSLM